MVAALGPQVLKLSARRSAGAHPYLTTPEHTAQARELIGPDAFLAPEHKVVLTTDAEQARAVGRKALDIYLNLANYLNNWKRLGFTDADVAKPGSDALVDAVVAYGTTEAIAARLKEHLAAGADHVPVQVLTGTDKLVPALAELAGPLGLQLNPTEGTSHDRRSRHSSPTSAASACGRSARPSPSRPSRSRSWATARSGSAAPRRRPDFVEPILEATETLQVATGIVNIWTARGR